jgi:hypothetical protein
VIRLVAYRLYLTAQVLLTTAAVLFVVGWSVIEVHDRHVASADFRCFQKQVKAFASAPQPSPEERLEALRSAAKYGGVEVPPAEFAAGKCHIVVVSSYQDNWYSERAWRGGETGSYFREYHNELGPLIVAVLAPLLLFAAYRWVSWLGKSPPEKGA